MISGLLGGSQVYSSLPTSINFSLYQSYVDGLNQVYQTLQTQLQDQQLNYTETTQQLVDQLQQDLQTQYELLQANSESAWEASELEFQEFVLQAQQTLTEQSEALFQTLQQNLESESMILLQLQIDQLTAFSETLKAICTDQIELLCTNKLSELELASQQIQTLLTSQLQIQLDEAYTEFEDFVMIQQHVVQQFVLQLLSNIQAQLEQQSSSLVQSQLAFLEQESQLILATQEQAFTSYSNIQLSLVQQQLQQQFQEYRNDFADEAQMSIDTLIEETTNSVQRLNTETNMLIERLNEASASFSKVNVGTILSFCSLQIPPSYLLCDGSAFDPFTYPQLYQLLGSAFVPDLRGQFLRGYDFVALRDPEGATRSLLSAQGSALGQHTHTGTISTHNNTTIGFSGTTGSSTISLRVNDNAGASSSTVLEFDDPAGASIVNQPNSNHTHPFSGQVTVPAHSHTVTIDSAGTSTETRPSNVSVVFIIKAL